MSQPKSGPRNLSDNFFHDNYFKIRNESEKSPFAFTPIGYSGYILKAYPLHSVQARRDKKE